MKKRKVKRKVDDEPIYFSFTQELDKVYFY